jgi:hypothetical protein
MGVQHAADIGMVGVHRGVHGDHGALDGRQVTLQQRPIQPNPYDHGGRMVSQEGPAVKYISSAPGTRTLTLPCPFAEIAPLATTRWAMSATCRQLFIHDELPSGHVRRTPAIRESNCAALAAPVHEGYGAGPPASPPIVGP